MFVTSISPTNIFTFLLCLDQSSSSYRQDAPSLVAFDKRCPFPSQLILTILPMAGPKRSPIYQDPATAEFDAILKANGNAYEVAALRRAQRTNPLSSASTTSSPQITPGSEIAGLATTPTTNRTMSSPTAASQVRSDINTSSVHQLLTSKRPASTHRSRRPQQLKANRNKWPVSLNPPSNQMSA